MAERAVLHLLLILIAPLELRGLDGVQAAPPGVGIAAPLRMQRRHPCESAPQRYTGADETSTEAVEQRSGLSAAQPLPDCPDAQFDDFSPERGIEAKRQ